jgi:hypothetical protein
MPATKQPDWKFVANLGDRTPLDYGGYFVYIDKTGVYEPEAELLALDDESDEDSAYTIYRVLLERKKLVEGWHGYLVPFKYDASWPHPVERYDEWFHEDLGSVAVLVGATKEQLEQDLTSADPKVRAHAYRAIYDYHGWENGDSYPLRVTRAEAEKRYKDELKAIRKGK